MFAGTALPEIARVADRIPAAQTDDSAAAVPRPASCRAARHDARWLPSRTPSRSARSGRNAAAWATPIACTSATRIAAPASFRFRRLAPVVRPTASRAPLRLISSAKGKVRTLFRGLNTTSTGPSQARGESRTASRIRRLMRLRSTAPPSTLPTVNPTRGPLWRSLRGLAPQEKDGHVAGELPPAVLIHPLEIRMLQQMLRLRKLAAGGGDVTRHSALAVAAGCSVTLLPARSSDDPCNSIGKAAMTCRNIECFAA